MMTENLENDGRSDHSQVESVRLSASELVTFDCGLVTLRGERWTHEKTRGNALFLHDGGQTRHAWGAWHAGGA